MSDYVNPDDLTVQRDEHGEVLPVDTQAGDLGKVRVLPLTYGAVQRRFGDGVEFNFDSADIADLVDEHIIKPDLSTAAGGQVTAEYIESMYPTAPRDLLMAILDVSGVEADVQATRAGGAQVQVAGN